MHGRGLGPNRKDQSPELPLGHVPPRMASLLEVYMMKWSEGSEGPLGDPQGIRGYRQGLAGAFQGRLRGVLRGSHGVTGIQGGPREVCS